MAAPADLFEAVIARLSGTLSATITGGIWGGVAPPGTSFPYAVLVEVGSSDEYTTPDNHGVGTLNTGQIQVSVFHTGRSAARAIGRTVASTLTDATLTFADGYLMNFRRASVITSLDDSLGQTAKPVWHDAQTFDYQIGGTL